MTRMKARKIRTAQSGSLVHRVIEQFDTLIPFLAISHEEVFRLIQRNVGSYFNANQSRHFPNTYTLYRTQIAHSAYVLGYSYFESFLSDLVQEVYLARPNMLPKDKQLKYSDVLESNSFDTLLNIMIKKEIVEVFYKRADQIVDYFEQKLRIKWPTSYKQAFVRASALRNCIVHNLGIADTRLAQVSTYKEGESIRLAASDVHLFGIKARDLVRKLYDRAHRLHLQKRNGS